MKSFIAILTTVLSLLALAPKGATAEVSTFKRDRSAPTTFKNPIKDRTLRSEAKKAKQEAKAAAEAAAAAQAEAKEAKKAKQEARAAAKAAEEAATAEAADASEAAEAAFEAEPKDDPEDEEAENIWLPGTTSLPGGSQLAYLGDVSIALGLLQAAAIESYSWVYYDSYEWKIFENILAVAGYVWVAHAFVLTGPFIGSYWGWYMGILNAWISIFMGGLE